MQCRDAIRIKGVLGTCGHLPVFLGFAPARVLHSASFADILDEDTGTGYQRPRNVAHSRSFRHYILQPGTSTIPLTFSLRHELAEHWRISHPKTGHAVLSVSRQTPCLAQVDCQHRLGELANEDTPFAFMAFVNLSLRQEMAMFNIINSRAKGLSSSLTDYHESNLLADLAAEAPHLFIARRLNEDLASPWYKLVRYGGETTSGLHRRTSLRMLQKSVHRFLTQTKDIPLGDVTDKYGLIVEYWKAVRSVFNDEWNAPRSHLITKGVGLYALMYLLSDLVRTLAPIEYNADGFSTSLRRMKGITDWSSRGAFANAGGQKGAVEVYHAIKKAAGL